MSGKLPTATPPRSGASAAPPHESTAAIPNLDSAPPSGNFTLPLPPPPPPPRSRALSPPRNANVPPQPSSLAPLPPPPHFKSTTPDPPQTIPKDPSAPPPIPITAFASRSLELLARRQTHIPVLVIATEKSNQLAWKNNLQLSHDAVFNSTKIEFEVEALSPKGKFHLAGKELVSPGFLTVLLHKQYGDDGDKDDDDEEERMMPDFEKGELIPILQGNSNSNSSKVTVAQSAPVWASLDVKEKMTTAPGYLTESELIGMMEKHGIGTDASIPTHIQNVQNRNYVRLESGRRLLPNKLGLVLVQGYHQIDSGLVLPKIRSDIEGQCNRIATGDMEKDEVVKRAIEMFEKKFDFFVKNIDRMDVLFGSSFSKLEDVGKPFTRCGLSRRYLQYIPGPPPRLYNKYTETVHSLPIGGDIKQWSGRNCPVEGCNFELCMYSVGAPPRTFPLCPNCFNSADWAIGESSADLDEKEDENKERQIKRMAGKSLTLECPLPDEHPLIDELYVSPDPDSDGVFILDPHFGPKWRLVSTRDATIIHLPKSVDKITILNEKDDVLGCHKMKVEFKAGESPLEGGETKYTCFYPTDATLQGSSRVFHGSERTASSGRGRGRGRGRGGRGRGDRGRGRR